MVKTKNVFTDKKIKVKLKKKKISPEEMDQLLAEEISYDHPVLLLYQLIRRCNDYITTETDKNLTILGSTQAQYQVLRILVDLNAVSMTKISKLLFRGKSNLTSLIDRMERSGLVERVSVEEDRRVSNIQITAKGKRLHDKVAKRHRSFILEKFKGLSDQEIEDLLQLLKKTAYVLNPDGVIFNVDAHENDSSN